MHAAARNLSGESVPWIILSDKKARVTGAALPRMGTQDTDLNDQNNQPEMFNRSINSERRKRNLAMLRDLFNVMQVGLNRP